MTDLSTFNNAARRAKGRKRGDQTPKAVRKQILVNSLGEQPPEELTFELGARKLAEGLVHGVADIGGLVAGATGIDSLGGDTEYFDAKGFGDRFAAGRSSLSDPVFEALREMGLWDRIGIGEDLSELSNNERAVLNALHFAGEVGSPTGLVRKAGGVVLGKAGKEAIKRSAAESSPALAAAARDVLDGGETLSGIGRLAKHAVKGKTGGKGLTEIGKSFAAKAAAKAAKAAEIAKEGLSREAIEKGKGVLGKAAVGAKEVALEARILAAPAIGSLVGESRNEDAPINEKIKAGQEWANIFGVAGAIANFGALWIGKKLQQKFQKKIKFLEGDGEPTDFDKALVSGSFKPLFNQHEKDLRRLLGPDFEVKRSLLFASAIESADPEDIAGIKTIYGVNLLKHILGKDPGLLREFDKAATSLREGVIKKFNTTYRQKYTKRPKLARQGDADLRTRPIVEQLIALKKSGSDLGNTFYDKAVEYAEKFSGKNLNLYSVKSDLVKDKINEALENLTITPQFRNTILRQIRVGRAGTGTIGIPLSFKELIAIRKTFSKKSRAGGTAGKAYGEARRAIDDIFSAKTFDPQTNEYRYINAPKEIAVSFEVAKEYWAKMNSVLGGKLSDRVSKSVGRGKFVSKGEIDFSQDDIYANAQYIVDNLVQTKDGTIRVNAEMYAELKKIYMFQRNFLADIEVNPAYKDLRSVLDSSIYENSVDISRQQQNDFGRFVGRAIGAQIESISNPDGPVKNAINLIHMHGTQLKALGNFGGIQDEILDSISRVVDKTVLSKKKISDLMKSRSGSAEIRDFIYANTENAPDVRESVNDYVAYQLASRTWKESESKNGAKWALEREKGVREFFKHLPDGEERTEMFLAGARVSDVMSMATKVVDSNSSRLNVSKTSAFLERHLGQTFIGMASAMRMVYRKVKGSFYVALGYVPNVAERYKINQSDLVKLIMADLGRKDKSGDLAANAIGFLTGNDPANFKRALDAWAQGKFERKILKPSVAEYNREYTIDEAAHDEKLAREAEQRGDDRGAEQIRQFSAHRKSTSPVFFDAQNESQKRGAYLP